MGLSPLYVMYAGDRTSEMASSGPLGWLGWPGAGWNNLTGDILSVPQISWWAACLVKDLRTAFKIKCSFVHLCFPVVSYTTVEDGRKGLNKEFENHSSE